MLLAASALLLGGAVWLLLAVRAARTRVRRVSWLLTRAGTAAAEARRASVVLGGADVVRFLRGGAGED